MLEKDVKAKQIAYFISVLDTTTHPHSHSHSHSHSPAMPSSTLSLQPSSSVQSAFSFFFYFVCLFVINDDGIKYPKAFFFPPHECPNEGTVEAGSFFLPLRMVSAPSVVHGGVLPSRAQFPDHFRIASSMAGGCVRKQGKASPQYLKHCRRDCIIWTGNHRLHGVLVIAHTNPPNIHSADLKKKKAVCLLCPSWQTLHKPRGCTFNN